MRHYKVASITLEDQGDNGTEPLVLNVVCEKCLNEGVPEGIEIVSQTLLEEDDELNCTICFGDR